MVAAVGESLLKFDPDLRIRLARLRIEKIHHRFPLELGHRVRQPFRLGLDLI
ncbi:MAG: hypothetical protein KDM64_00460 [Verrucomicrobiae bacterium]|nr:hypothetical protein [Verrucomicrobiae bacterium]